MNLNLENLTEEELKHIENVLQRDISLSAGKNFSPQKIGRMREPPPSVVVMSIIKEITGRSQGANSENPEPSSFKNSQAEENIFSSFAEMISRRFSTESGINKEDKDKKEKKNIDDDKTGKKRVPFKYNHRETIKHKPTLLQLAMNKNGSPTRMSLPAIIHTKKIDVPAHRIRERGNAIFSSLPASFNSSTGAEAPMEKPKTVASPDIPPQERRPPRVANNFAKSNNIRRSLSSDSRSIPETINEIAEQITVPEINLRSPSNDELFADDKEYMGTDAASYFPTEKNCHEDLIFAEFDNDERDYDISEVDSDTAGINVRSDNPDDPMSSTTSCSSLNSSNFDKGNDVTCLDSSHKLTATVGYSRSFNAPSPARKSDGPYHTLPRSPKPNRSGSVSLHTDTLLMPLKKDKRRYTASTKTLDTLSVSTAGSSPLHHSSGATSPASDEVTHNAQASSGNPVGNLEISLVYYSSESFKKKVKRTIIPARGTKSQKSCDVLSRKEYVAVTGAKLTLSSKTKSGALPQSDGELHLEVKGAKLIESVVGKHKLPNAYVKCYLLPDKYHSSKMKSAMLKKTLTPQWDHKFIFAGFSQSDFLDRSIEIIISDAHFKKQYILGGVRLSVGRGTATQPWINSSNQEAYVWKTALQMSGNKVITLLPIRDNVKPTYV